MRLVVVAVSLALGTTAAAQTTPAEAPGTPPPDAPVVTDAPPPAPEAPAAAAQCSVDRDCPGALFCVSG